jgi:hypothetical protein
MSGLSDMRSHSETFSRHAASQARPRWNAARGLRRATLLVPGLAAAAAFALPASNPNHFDAPRLDSEPSQPLFFESAASPGSSQSLFLAHGLNCNVSLAPGEVIMTLASRPPQCEDLGLDRIAFLEQPPAQARVVHIRMPRRQSPPALARTRTTGGQSQLFRRQ